MHAEADPDTQGADQDGHPGQIHPQEPEPPDEPQRQDAIMEQGRDRVGLAGGNARAWIDVLVQHEAQEGREQGRPHHREPEGQDVPHGEADRAALQRGREDGRPQGEHGFPQADVAERAHDPAQHGQPDEAPGEPAFQAGAMVLHQVQRPQRPDAQSIGQHAGAHPDRRAEGQGQDTPGQDARCQQMRQPSIAEAAGHQPGGTRQHAEPEGQAQEQHLERPRRRVRGPPQMAEHPPRDDDPPQRFTDQEHLAETWRPRQGLEHNIEGEEAAQRVEAGPYGGGEDRPGQAQHRQESHQVVHGADRERELGKGRGGEEQREQPRGRDRVLEDVEGGCDSLAVRLPALDLPVRRSKRERQDQAEPDVQRQARGGVADVVQEIGPVGGSTWRTRAGRAAPASVQRAACQSGSPSLTSIPVTACCCAWASCASACSHWATARATRLWRSSTATRCASMGSWAALRLARVASNPLEDRCRRRRLLRGHAGGVPDRVQRAQAMCHRLQVRGLSREHVQPAGRLLVAPLPALLLPLEHGQSRLSLQQGLGCRELQMIVALTSGSPVWIVARAGLGLTSVRTVRSSVATSVACVATSATGITASGADAGVVCDSIRCCAPAVQATTRGAAGARACSCRPLSMSDASRVISSCAYGPCPGNAWVVETAA